MNDPRCGRLDVHEAHEWHGPRQPGWSAAHSTYQCPGAPVIEGGYFAEWDAEDDAAEDRADREKRESA